MSRTGRFIDSFGFLWQVMEVAPSDARGTRGDGHGWLYFTSRGCTMVLREYPADWQSLGWKGLDALRLRGDVLSSDITRLPRTTAGVPVAMNAEL